MEIYGLMKTTLLDYPGLVASTIFTGGCNFNCPFCHNMNLVKNYHNEIPISQEEIFNHLSSRSGLIDGVCITGGEPTLQNDLIDFIKKVKSLGLQIKLDSNGSKTSVLEYLISENLVDYIAIDIKTSFNKYGDICGFTPEYLQSDAYTNILTNIKNTVNLLIQQQSIDYEFRTTIIKEFHNEEVIEDIGKSIVGARKIALQSFVDSTFVPNHSLHPYEKNKLQDFALQLEKYVKEVEIRGIN